MIPAASVVEIDGYLCDEETGEILGLATPTPEFAVTDRASAEWVLDRILRAEADLAAVDHSPAVIHARAVIENADSIRAERRRRVDWLRRRFGAELGEFARRQLAGGKSRTWKSPVGAISLRTVRGGLRVVDAEAALRVARVAYPHAVKRTEEFRVSLLTPDERDDLLRGLAPGGWSADEEAHAAFAVAPDEERVDVRTGVAR